MRRYYNDPGINWETIYEVEYEDDDILVLVYRGTYHRFDTERTWKHGKHGGVTVGGDFATVGGKPKLVEIKQL